MRTIIYSFLFALLLISCVDYEADHETRIGTNFQNLKTAILANKGSEALEYVHANTTSYFSYVLYESRYTDSSEISSYSVKDKLMILLVRHLCTKDQLSDFDRNTLMAFLIDQWTLGKNSINDVTIRHINVDKDTARCQVFKNNLKTGNYVDFYQVQQQWKIDISLLYRSLSQGLRELIKNSRMEENDFILNAIHEFSGRQPDSTIWKPKLKRAVFKIKKSKS
ncbi:MAG: hypothetical protein AAF617_17765 [Bacteroidota bacterium]